MCSVLKPLNQPYRQNPNQGDNAALLSSLTHSRTHHSPALSAHYTDFDSRLNGRRPRGALRGAPGSACPQPESNATELPSCAHISARAAQRRRRWRWWRGEEQGGRAPPGPRRPSLAQRPVVHPPQRPQQRPAPRAYVPIYLDGKVVAVAAAAVAVHGGKLVFRTHTFRAFYAQHVLSRH